MEDRSCAALRPSPESLEARLADLSPHDQATYQKHQDRIAAWRAANPDRNQFLETITGQAPTMPEWLLEKLNGSARVTADMNQRQAADAYRHMAFGE